MPLIKYSFLPIQSFCIIFEGIDIAFELEERRFNIMACQIGAAPVIPEAKY